MNLQEGKNNNKPLSINMVLIIIVIILVLILILVSVFNLGNNDLSNTNNDLNNQIINEIENEIKEPNAVTNEVNATVNEITDPNANNPEVAKIGEQTYTSLQEAINAVEDLKVTPAPTASPMPTPEPIEPTTITLLKDITGTFIVGANKNILIDMGNFSITGSGNNPSFTVNGNLVLQNGTIICKYTRRELSALKISNSGTLICDTINFDLSASELGWAITNDGRLNLKSTKIDYIKGTAVNNNGTIEEISGDSYISSNGNFIALYNLGTIKKMTGGEIVSNSYAIFNSGTIEEMSGNLKVNSAHSFGIYNSGKIGNIIDNVEMNSGSEDNATIYNNGGTINKIVGEVKINAEHYRAIYNMGVITEISGNVNINTNGEYAVSTIYNSNPGELTIMGGTVSHKNGGISVFREGGEVTITGGNIPSKYNC